jgi:DNA-binding IclR family transcriptional regulator
MTDAKSSSEDAVVSALKSKPDSTAGELADAAGVGRSTVGKVLARLERAERVRRTRGGRDGSRRLPDRWKLAARKTSSRRRSHGKRLRPGELDGLVVDYLAKHAEAGALSPTAVAKGLGRSAGAVGNCLARLSAAGRVRQVSDRPRRYSLG